jgi:hypothetical protein
VLVLGSVPAAAAPAGEATWRRIAVFRGDVKGIVEIIELGGRDGRVRITMASIPRGVTRVVGATVPCGTPVTSETRAFSLDFEKLTWVRRVVEDLLPSEGVADLVSIRLVKPGSPPTQAACRPARLYQDVPTSTASSPAIELENTLVTSYSFAGRTRGHLVLGPLSGEPGTLPLRGVIQRNESNLLRLVGSAEPCGTPHDTGDTVFDAPIPVGGFIHDGDWSEAESDVIASLRLYQGSGFAKPAGCMQHQVDVVRSVL